MVIVVWFASPGCCEIIYRGSLVNDLYLYIHGCWIHSLFMTFITVKHFGSSNRADVVFIHLVNTSFFPLSQIPTELLWGPHVTRIIYSLNGCGCGAELPEVPGQQELEQWWTWVGWGVGRKQGLLPDVCYPQVNKCLLAASGCLLPPGLLLCVHRKSGAPKSFRWELSILMARQ